ncbi:unnamed protein product, partial [Hapterophycus canaliculatus]
TFLDSLHLDREQLSDFSNSEGHFLYLRQKPGTDATAYNLEVGWDYYTLSRAGITHLKDSSSDFTALDRWEREYALFHHIRR